MLHPLRLVLLLALASLAPRAGAQGSGSLASGGAEGLAELAARDARLAFNTESAARARAVLASGPLEVEARAAALLALAGGRTGAEFASLESALADGKPLEQRAALFALGAAGAAGWPALERGLAALPAGGEEAACLALLAAERSGVAPAHERLLALARTDDALGRAAAAVLAHASGDGPPPAGLAEYYELRWRAARAFGLVDGLRGQKALAAELFADAAFRQRVVLLAAAELPAPELEAHLFELLLAGEREEVLRVAAVQLPTKLLAAHETGQWQLSLDAWHTVLSALDGARAERRAQGLLELAFRTAPVLEPEAGLLLVRAGGDLPWTWVSEQLERGDAARSSALVEACGERGEVARIPDLADLLERRPGLQGVGLVALARLGHPSAKEELERLAKAPAGPEREPVLAALARVLHDPRLWPRAEEALRRDDLEPGLRLELQLGLVQAGARGDHAALRAALRERPRGELGLRLVRALARDPDHADLDTFVELFPREGEHEWNVELALALVRQRHPALDGLLATSLWTDPWNTSLLAGGLIARAGPRALADALAAPPRTAREEDLRRVGFALGEWGGIAAVEELTRTHSEGDPALQGALLGALFNRAAEPATAAAIRPPGQRDLAPRGPPKSPKKRRKAGQ